jgi:hypothetical protein
LLLEEALTSDREHAFEAGLLLGLLACEAASETLASSIELAHRDLTSTNRATIVRSDCSTSRDTETSAARAIARMLFKTAMSTRAVNISVFRTAVVLGVFFTVFTISSS